MTAGKEVTPKDARGAEKLHAYWEHGAGSLKIKWGTEGDWSRCVAELGQHIANPEGYCDLMHHRVLGIWPATHAKIDRDALKKMARNPQSHIH